MRINEVTSNIKNISSDVDGGSLDGYVVDTSEPQLRNYLHKQHASDEIADMLSSRYSRIGIIRNLFVDEESRSQGIGKDLVSTAIKDAFRNGAEAIILVSDTGEDNEFDLTKWYEGFGFTTIGDVGGDPLMILDNN